MGELVYVNKRSELYEGYRDARMREVMVAINYLRATNYLHGSARERLKEAKLDVLKSARDLGEYYLVVARREMKKVTVRSIKRAYKLEKREELRRKLEREAKLFGYS